MAKRRDTWPNPDKWQPWNFRGASHAEVVEAETTPSALVGVIMRALTEPTGDVRGCNHIGVYPALRERAEHIAKAVDAFLAAGGTQPKNERTACSVCGQKLWSGGPSPTGGLLPHKCTGPPGRGGEGDHGE